MQNLRPWRVALVSVGLLGALIAVARTPQTTPQAKKPAQQFVLFDATFKYDKNDADNSVPSKSHYYIYGYRLNPQRPKNWTQPVDFRNGTVHVRVEVLEKPETDDAVQWSLCYIPNKGQGNGYGCAGTDRYTSKGIYEKDVSMTEFWENKGVVWSEGIKQMDLVMKDKDGVKVHLRPDPEKFLPTKVRFTMIQVAAGAKYDPSLVPNMGHGK